MRNLNLSTVTDSSRLPAGGYVLKVVDVVDVSEKEYLRLELDIAEGEYKDYYQNLYNKYAFWGLTWYMSYKERAIGLFKGGIKAFRASNASLIWEDDAENDEKKLRGCLIGGLLREEEYNANDGSVKSSLKIYKTMSADDIRRGNFTVPEPKKLESRNTSNGVVDTTTAFEPVKDEDLPFV